MATFYFPGSTVQRDVMPAPYVKDAGHCLYPESALPDLVTSRLGNNVFSGSRDSRNGMLMQTRVTVNSMQDTDRRMNCSHLVNRNSMSADVGMQMQLGILQGGLDLQLQQSGVSAIHGQGLSLNLGTQLPSGTLQCLLFSIHKIILVFQLLLVHTLQV